MGLLERWARPFKGLGNAIAGLTAGVYRVLGGPGRLLQDLMNGSMLGHSLHGMLTDAVVGAVTAVLVLDAAAVLFGANVETATMIVLGFGALSAWGAALAGLTDHKDIDPGDARNVATLHGLINLSATVLYTIAFFVRLAGGVGAGRWIVAGGLRAASRRARSSAGTSSTSSGSWSTATRSAVAGARRSSPPCCPRPSWRRERPRRPCSAPPRSSSFVAATWSTPCGRPAHTPAARSPRGASTGDSIICPWHALGVPSARRGGAPRTGHHAADHVRGPDQRGPGGGPGSARLGRDGPSTPANRLTTLA